MQQQERYLTQTGTYLSFAAGATGVAFKTFSGDSAANPAYKIGAEACALDGSLRECVRVFAVPQFTDDKCGTLGIVSTGSKTPEACWR
jgi:Tfp pilus assembly protein PilE